SVTSVGFQDDLNDPRGHRAEEESMGRRDVAQPQVLSLTPGRLRVHLPAWTGDGDGGQRVEAGLRKLAGVRDVQANPLTGNVLIHFDPGATSVQALLAASASGVAAGDD